MKGYSISVFACVVSLILGSCDQWEFKKIPSETYLAETWKAIDLDEVDTYPYFDSCNSKETKEDTLACFEKEVIATFYNSLSQHNVVVTEKLQDTIHIDFVVNEKGKYCIDTLRLSPQIKAEVPQLEMWIHEACEQLPQAHPATKMGIPVKTRFKIPLIFQTED